MKVGIDITPVIYEGTGVGTYTKELVRHLLPLSPKTDFVLFASTLRGRKKFWDFAQSLKIYPNFTLKVYPFPPAITELAWNKFHRLTVEKVVGNVDVFHAWDWQQPPAEKAKLVTTVHDLTPLKFPQDQHPKTVRVHTRRLHWVAHDVDAIIADSEATRNDVIEYLRINPEKVYRVYLGASSQYTEFRKQGSPFGSAQGRDVRSQEIDRVKQKYHLGENYLLSVGTQEPRKNLQRVIEAFRILQSSSLELAIVGKYGWDRADSGFKIHDSRNIKILGLVAEQDLPALYAGAQALVYPSLYEGFGLPVIEAMSIGCPVVTSDRGSLKEVADGAAVLVNPESLQSIATGIKSALVKREILTEAGLIQSEHFSWEKTAQETMEVYEKVCS